MTDDPAVAALRPVVEAWAKVEHELAITGDHLESGGRQPEVRVVAAE